MPPTLRVPFGWKDDRLWEPRQVPNGKACGCVCPACQRRLIAKQNHKTPHFAHAPGEDCAKALETAIHLAAKQLIADRQELRLPILTFTNPYARRVYGDEPKPEVVYVERIVSLATVAVEAGLGDMRPDIVVTSGDVTYLVEIAVTHFVDDAKQAKINARQLPTIEIDVSRLHGQATFAGLANLLFTHHPYPAKWLYHPKITELTREAWEEDQITKSIAEMERQEQAEALAEATERFRQYRELRPKEKLAKNCRHIGLSQAQLAQLTTFVPWEKAFNCPRAVWQSAVLAYLARQHQEQDIAVSAGYHADFTPKECLGWLELTFTVDYDDPKYKVAFWKYVHFLTAIGLLTKDQFGKYEIVIPPELWSGMQVIKPPVGAGQPQR